MDPVLGTVVAAIGVIAASWLTYRASRAKQRSDTGQQMIDQHQEDIIGLRARVGSLERAQRIQGDYIGELRRHIADGKPPPPPPYPSGLIT